MLKEGDAILKESQALTSLWRGDISHCFIAFLAPLREQAHKRCRLMKTSSLAIASCFWMMSVTHPVLCAGPTAREALVTLAEVETKSGVDLFIENNSYGDVTVALEVDMTNLTPSKPLPVTVAVAPHGKKRVVRLFVDDPQKRWKYRSKFSVAYGALNTKHDADYHYRLPFGQGKAYRVIQTFGGRVSHEGESEYAVDFAMPERSPVCAARPGRVVATQSSSSRGGPQKKFRDDGNFIYIRHADRTLGVYVHLKKDGVFVESGDYVRRGQLIGLSGNTGWSSRPHLHFGVYRLIGGKMGESFPFLFESKSGLVKAPLLGRAYSVKP